MPKQIAEGLYSNPVGSFLKKSMEIFTVDRHTYQEKLFKLKIHTDLWAVVNGFQRAAGIYRKQLGRCIKRGCEEVVCRRILT